MNQKGFTLTELIIAIFITGLIFSLTSGYYILLKNIYQKADNRAEIVQNGRVMLDRMVREIRQSPKISTSLPNDPALNPPNELQFQDGHETSEIRYIRYYQENSNLKRQVIVYYFGDNPSGYVYQNAIDQNQNPPIQDIVDDKLIGEYVADIEFWGDKIININLYLTKNDESKIFFTSVFGRNL
jgi:prepilin-type N-terminal cleavage/methylation domain-containing protein